METFKAEGIILQTNDFGDANRVVTIFTKEFGKIDANAYGCRRTKNPMSGAMQMFNHVAVELSSGSKVDTIRDADILHFYGNLTADLERLGYASLFFEVVNRMTFPRQSELETFNLLKKSLPVLNSRNPKIAALIGICQFLETTGEQLNFSRCVRCGEEIFGDAAISLLEGGAICMNCVDAAQDCRPYPDALRRTFETILSFDWRDGTKLSFNSRQLHAAENFLFDYLHTLLGGNLKSEEFIREYLV